MATTMSHQTEPEGRIQPSTDREIPVPAPREDREMEVKSAERGGERRSVFDALDDAVRKNLSAEMSRTGVVREQETIDLTIAGREVSVTRETETVSISVAGQNEAQTKTFICDHAAEVTDAVRRAIEARQRELEAQERRQQRREAYREEQKEQYRSAHTENRTEEPGGR